MILRPNLGGDFIFSPHQSTQLRHTLLPKEETTTLTMPFLSFIVSHVYLNFFHCFYLACSYSILHLHVCLCRLKIKIFHTSMCKHSYTCTQFAYIYIYMRVCTCESIQECYVYTSTYTCEQKYFPSSS